jgi:hypothetical protein
LTSLKKKKKLNIKRSNYRTFNIYLISYDSQKRPVYFDDELRSLRLNCSRARQLAIYMLKPYAEKVLIFIDEPILSAIGTSAYLGVNRDEASRMLQEIVKHIKRSGGIAGIHCCSKADCHILSSG